jgi:hypothetical protein
MTSTPTTPKTEQLQFRSSKTGIHNLDTYLEACEFGTSTLPVVLGTLFTEDGTVNPESVQFRVKPGDADNTLQARFGIYTDTTSGWLDTNQTIFRQTGAYTAGTNYNRLDFAEDDNNLYCCIVEHTATATRNTSYWSLVLDGTAILQAITNFNTLSAPRLQKLEAEVILQLGIV